MVSESVSCPVSMMIGALKPPLAQGTHDLTAVGIRKSDIHQHEIWRLALAAVLPLRRCRRQRLRSSCSDKLLHQRIAQIVRHLRSRILRAIGA